jgi:hypothetical protein
MSRFYFDTMIQLSCLVQGLSGEADDRSAVTKRPAFVTRECPSPFSQQLASGPHCKPLEYSPLTHKLFPEDPS